MFEEIQRLIQHPEQFDDIKASTRQALSALHDYLKSHVNDKEALEYRVILLERAKRFTLAKQTAKKLLSLDSEEPKYLDMYGHTLLLTGEFNNAEATFLRAWKLDPDSGFAFGKKYREAKELSLLKMNGNEAVTKRNYEDAISVYTRGITRCEESSVHCTYIFLNNRSACYLNTHRYDLALRDIDRAIEEYPHLPKPYLRAITCIEQLQLTERVAEIPMMYLNALYSMEDGANPSAVARKYVDFLKKNGAYRPAVRPIGSLEVLNHILTTNPDTLIVLELYASWCGPCKKLAPVIEELSVSYPSAIFLKADADKLRDIANKYDLYCFPMVVLIRNNQTLHTVSGYDPNETERLVRANALVEPDTLYEAN